MGKVAAAVVGVVAAVAIAVVAPYLAPFALGAIGTTTATATALAIATAVIGTVLAVGVSLAFRALGIGAIPSAKNTGAPQVFRQSITDSFILYGKRRVGGLLVFFHAKKQAGTKRHYRYFVIACAGHQCKGAVQYMLNDEVVIVNGAGLVTTGKYKNNAWLWFVRGTPDDVANATFVAECGGKWTAAHRGREIAKLYAKFALTDDVVEAGMPNMTVVAEGKDTIIDTRDGVSKYTRNGILVIYDWMKLQREEGGFGSYDDEIPDDDWISAQANVCDEEINGNPRYSLDAILTTGSPPGDVRDAFIVNIAGRYSYVGGKHLIRPGYWVPVSVTLSEDDLAGAIQVSPFMPPDVVANEVSGTFINPDDGYQGKPFPTQTSGSVDVRQLDVDLAFTTVPDQAARIARIMLRRAEAEKSAVWPMNCVGIGVTALDTVQVNCSRYGLSNYAWWVPKWALSADYGVVLSLQEENEEIYADHDPVALDEIPTIDQAEPVVTDKQAAEFISTSSIIDPDPTTAVLRATETTISVDDHLRRYSDFTVEVLGSAGSSLKTEADEDLVLEDGGQMLLDEPPAPDITVDIDGNPLVAGTTYHVGYEDIDRVGGTVTYIASKRLRDVTNSGVGGASPGMHYVGTIPTATAGSGGTNTGGGSLPPGYNGFGAEP